MQDVAVHTEYIFAGFIFYSHRYRPRDPKMNSEAIQFKAGANQTYSNSAHVFNPSIYSDTDLIFDFDKEVYPIVIYCHALEGDGNKLCIRLKCMIRIMCAGS